MDTEIGNMTIFVGNVNVSVGNGMYVRRRPLSMIHSIDIKNVSIGNTWSKLDNATPSGWLIYLGLDH